MKKIVIVSALILISGICFAQTTPVAPTTLPRTAVYSSGLIDNNTLRYPEKDGLKVYIATGGAVSVTGVTGSTITVTGVTGSTITFTNPSIAVTGVTGSTITFTNPSIAVTGVTGSSVTVTNGFIDATGSTVTVSNPDRFTGMVSSGTSGIITGETTATITVADKVINWNFKVRNLSGTEAISTITPSLYGTKITLFDGDGDSEDITIPQAVTFLIELPVSATMQYTINTVK